MAPRHWFLAPAFLGAMVIEAFGQAAPPVVEQAPIGELQPVVEPDPVAEETPEADDPVIDATKGTADTAPPVSAAPNAVGPLPTAPGPPAIVTPDLLQAMVEDHGGAVLRGLDKITAKVEPIYAPFDVPVRFGSLQLTVRTCHKRPPEETPEQSVFIEIDEPEPGVEPRRLFTGWMFWSSPALNALEHPVYDVWLIDCIAKAPLQSVGSE